MEQKELAKDIDRIFASKQHLLFLMHSGLFALVIVFGFAKNPILAHIFLVAALAFIPFHISRYNLYSYAGKLMVCRALAGKKISDDPYSEGIERMKYFGCRKFNKRSKICGTTLFNCEKGSGRIVNYACKNTAALLFCYQLGCYEATDDDQFNELVDYFLQDDRNYIGKTIKTEVKSCFIIAANLFFIGICLVLFMFTKAPLMGFSVLALLVIFFVLGICQSQSMDFNTLCEYSDFVNTRA